MSVETTNTGTELFYTYLSEYKDEVRSESAEGYYHVDVVAEAYNKGLADGEKKGKEEFIEQILKKEVETFTHKAHQVYILSQNVITYIKELGYNLDSLHIDLSPSCPKVILAIKNDFLNDDTFVESAYSKVIENKKIFSKLFNTILDMGFVASDNLDEQELLNDGFGYTERY